VGTNKNWIVASVVGILLALASSGKESVYFKNGFSLEADSHKIEDQTVVLYVGGGTLSFPAEDIRTIEMMAEPARPREPSVSNESQLKPDEVLGSAALQMGLDAAFVRSVAQIESGLRANAVSVKGAIGLMQLMPTTAAMLKVDPQNISENAVGGAQYLRELLLRYRGNSVLALAAYNAGPGAIDRYKGLPPYPETQRYILSVLREYRKQLAKDRTATAPRANKTTSIN
jgi:soluble lytic murein transglycosylase-like protein